MEDDASPKTTPLPLGRPSMKTNRTNIYMYNITLNYRVWRRGYPFQYFLMLWGIQEIWILVFQWHNWFFSATNLWVYT